MKAVVTCATTMQSIDAEMRLIFPSAVGPQRIAQGGSVAPGSGALGPHLSTAAPQQTCLKTDHAGTLDVAHQCTRPSGAARSSRLGVHSLPSMWQVRTRARRVLIAIGADTLPTDSGAAAPSPGLQPSAAAAEPDLMGDLLGGEEPAEAPPAPPQLSAAAEVSQPAAMLSPAGGDDLLGKASCRCCSC